MLYLSRVKCACKAKVNNSNITSVTSEETSLVSQDRPVTVVRREVLSYLDQPGDAARTHKPLSSGPGNPSTCPKPLPNELGNPMPGHQRNHLFLVSCGCLKPLVSELRCSVMGFLPEGQTTLYAHLLLVRTRSCDILILVHRSSRSVGLPLFL